MVLVFGAAKQLLLMGAAVEEGSSWVRAPKPLRVLDPRASFPPPRSPGRPSVHPRRRGIGESRRGAGQRATCTWHQRERGVPRTLGRSPGWVDERTSQRASVRLCARAGKQGARGFVVLSEYPFHSSAHVRLTRLRMTTEQASERATYRLTTASKRARDQPPSRQAAGWQASKESDRHAYRLEARQPGKPGDHQSTIKPTVLVSRSLEPSAARAERHTVRQAARQRLVIRLARSVS